MDVKDRIILFELSKNARIPLKALAKKIRMSESSTLYRLERLYKEKILLGTNTIINAYKLGYVGFRTLLTLKRTNTVVEKTILDWLVQREETGVVGVSKHLEEIFLMSWVKSSKVFYEFIQEFKENFGMYVGGLEIDVYQGAVYFPRSYLVKDIQVDDVVVNYSSYMNHDGLDISILKHLAYDARKSALAIARELKKPVKTIINRIRSLEKKKIIAGYSINVDTKKMGYTYYKLNIVFSSPIPFSTLLSFAKQSKNAVYIDKAINRFDFELNVEVESETRLDEILVELKKMGSGFEVLEIKQLDTFLKLGFLSDE